MTPKPPVAAKSNGAPQWLIQAGMEGGWIGKDGKAAPVGKKAPAAKPASTDNSRGYTSAQGLSGLSAGFGGLDLSSSPSIPKKGEGIKMDHGIRTIGQDKGTKLLTAHAPKFGIHTPKAPTFKLHPDTVLPGRSGSSFSRAAGPKPKTPTFVGSPDKLTPSGVDHGVRTYALVPPKAKGTDSDIAS